MREAAPELQAVGKNFNSREYGGACSRKSRGGLKEGIREAREERRQVEGETAEGTRCDPDRENEEHRFALGQVLSLSKTVDVLAGLRFDPIRYSLGGRAAYGGMSLSYAYLGHPELGATHAFGFCWTR